MTKTKKFAVIGECMVEQLRHFDSLYFSGITLALYNEKARGKLFEFLDTFREGGGNVLPDNNPVICL